MNPYRPTGNSPRATKKASSKRSTPATLILEVLGAVIFGWLVTTIAPFGGRSEIFLAATFIGLIAIAFISWVARFISGPHKKRGRG